jgi:hypothetical protein
MKHQKQQKQQEQQGTETSGTAVQDSARGSDAEGVSLLVLMGVGI